MYSHYSFLSAMSTGVLHNKAEVSSRVVVSLWEYMYNSRVHNRADNRILTHFRFPCKSRFSISSERVVLILTRTSRLHQRKQSPDQSIRRASIDTLTFFKIICNNIIYCSTSPPTETQEASSGKLLYIILY